MRKQLCMLGNEDCRIAVFGKTERTVRWEGNGEKPGKGCETLPMGKPAVNGLGSFYRYHNHFFTLDMVFLLKPEDNATQILDEIKEFLAKRGMEISERKTKITAATDGFDFLGWHFLVQKNGKFRSYPSEENYKAFRKKIKAIINSSNYGVIHKRLGKMPIKVINKIQNLLLQVFSGFSVASF